MFIASPFYLMKNSFKTLLLATAVTASSAFALTSNTFVNGQGEIMLGFHAASGTGAGQNLMVNLGSFQQFDNENGATFAFSSSIVADLNATYGSEWSTSGLVNWSLIGTTGSTTTIDGVNQRTIFMTNAAGTGTESIVVNSNSSTSTTTNVNRITSIGTSYNAFETTANSTVSVVVASSNANSMQALLELSNNTRFGPVNQVVASGAGSALDFYALVPTGAVPSGLAIDGSEHLYTDGANFLGTFTLDASGLSFTASGASAVPEPSTYAALAGAAVLGLAAYRRRSAVRA